MTSDVSRTRDRQLHPDAPRAATSPAKHNFCLPMRRTTNGTIIEPRKEGVRYDVDEGNGTFYIHVNDTDPSYR